MHLLHYFWGFDINTTAYRLDKYILTKELHTLALEEHILPSRATQLPYIPRRCEWTSIYSLRAAFKLELITDKRLIRVFVCRLIRISFLSRERKREFPPSWSGKFKQKIARIWVSSNFDFPKIGFFRRKNKTHVVAARVSRPEFCAAGMNTQKTLATKLWPQSIS